MLLVLPARRVGAIFTRLLTAEAAASAGRNGGRWGARRGLGFRDFLGTGTPGARDGSGEATTSARARSPARESRGAGNDNLLRSDADGGWELRRGRGVSGGVCGWVGVCVPTSVLQVLIEVFATTTKICTRGRSTRAHALGFVTTST